MTALVSIPLEVSSGYELPCAFGSSILVLGSSVSPSIASDTAGSFLRSTWKAITLQQIGDLLNLLEVPAIATKPSHLLSSKSPE